MKADFMLEMLLLCLGWPLQTLANDGVLVELATEMSQLEGAFFMPTIPLSPCLSFVESFSWKQRIKMLSIQACKDLKVLTQ